MNTRNSSKSGLFLMELLMGILFFSVACAVCVKLFVTSSQLSRQSVSLNHAVSLAESIAESFYGCNGDPKALSQLLPSEENGLYADVTLYEENELLHCKITVYENDPQEIPDTSCIYQLHVSLFPKEETSNE